ncbi:DUF6912 family protein [Streptomyces sp. BA2]|uniref:DUF6912 family protein n=1 Tax=Streptomyces sp. BA2 TaxID=436595 RepID=UPI001320B49B|nr:hypothetical protein [Streptomyces sp. BA2]MWA11494.1 hypothetical protein [Streptomyces sp. BA2]
MRVYVPLTLSRLAEVHKAGELGPGPLTAYAVTPALREWYVSDDIEELEYAALGRAALASLRLIAGDPGAARRRVVLAADVPDGALEQGPRSPEGGLGEVRVAGVLGLKKVAAVHVDAGDAEGDVAAAVGVLEAADQGDEDARFTVDGVEDHELLWFATQEIPGLIS